MPDLPWNASKEQKTCSDRHRRAARCLIDALDSKLIKKIRWGDHGFLDGETKKKREDKITQGLGRGYKWPQVGQQVETMKTKYPRLLWAACCASVRTLRRSFIFVQAFQASAKNFERAAKRRVVTLCFHRVWFEFVF